MTRGSGTSRTQGPSGSSRSRRCATYFSEKALTDRVLSLTEPPLPDPKFRGTVINSSRHQLYTIILLRSRHFFAVYVAPLRESGYTWLYDRRQGRGHAPSERAPNPAAHAWNQQPGGRAPFRAQRGHGAPGVKRPSRGEDRAPPRDGPGSRPG